MPVKLGSQCRVLIALDKFKGAIGSAQACEIVADVLRQERAEWQLHSVPFSDGGDGFAELLTGAAGGEWLSTSVDRCLHAGGIERVQGQFGRVAVDQIPVAARALLGVRAGQILGLLDLASVDGLCHVSSADRDPMYADTRGTGQLIRACAASGVDCILLGVGGSATNDLGLGALGELGLQFESLGGRRLENPCPGNWSRLVAVGGCVQELPPLRVACDVSNPLLGPLGATAVYGPQKGLDAVSCGRIERQAERVSRLVCEALGVPLSTRMQAGAGAAGGIAFGLMAAAGATLVPGFELVSHWLGLGEQLSRADLILTGEGCFDESSGFGKGPGALVKTAVERGVHACVFAGKISPSDLLSSWGEGIEGVGISPPELPLSLAMGQTPELLARAVRQWLARGVS